jgi:hypothetical protein
LPALTASENARDRERARIEPSSLRCGVRYSNLASLISIDTIGVSWIGGRGATETQTDVNVPREFFFPVTAFAFRHHLCNFSANASGSNVRAEMLSKIQFNGVGELASLHQRSCIRRSRES